MRIIVSSLLVGLVVGFSSNNNQVSRKLLVGTKTSLLSRSAVAVPMTDDVAEKELAPENAWVKNLDYDAFGKEVTELGRDLLKSQGQDDVDHLNKIVSWRNICALIGVSTMWLTPNPLTVLALSTWTYASWTMIAHHTCHGGYNRVDAGSFNSRGFARGSLLRRLVDWCDWMHPEAWNIEHNRLHHYHLGELKDPDLAQRNADLLRGMKMPVWAKYAGVVALMPIWKWFYYAPNTYKQWKMSQNKENLPEELDAMEAATFVTFFSNAPADKASTKLVDPPSFFAKVLSPFLLSRFVLLPAPLLFVPGGMTLFLHAVANLVLADLVTNIHGFVTIVTNHAGDDVYTFDDEVKPKSGAFYVRQVVGSVNYPLGNDALDFAHGWLNYQIEHHVWPDLSMLAYQRGAPRLKAICEKHGVPYVQENVLTRLFKTMDVMVGKKDMRVFPTSYEPIKHKANQNNGVSWKNTHGAIDDE